MKALLSYIAILFSVILFVGCSKNIENAIPKDDRVANLLAGNGTISKNWRLDKIFINEIEQPLTNEQKLNFKIYTADPLKTMPTNSNMGTFKNQEGLIGSWKLSSNGGDFVSETMVDNFGTCNKANYLINSISIITLDIEQTVNYKTTREVYKVN